MSHSQLNWISVFLAYLLLGGAVWERCTLIAPASAKEYHSQVTAAFHGFASRQGDWVGEDLELPAEATKALHPNSFLKRQYVNVRTGERCSLMLIHCSDARDLLCHYPPVCYPGQGWRQVRSEPRCWSVGQQQARGMVYEFSRTQFESNGGMVAANMMIVPTGRFEPDMRSIEEASSDPRSRHFGIAQLQITVDGAVPETERESIFEQMIEIHRPLFDAIHNSPLAVTSKWAR